MSINQAAIAIIRTQASNYRDDVAFRLHDIGEHGQAQRAERIAERLERAAELLKEEHETSKAEARKEAAEARTEAAEPEFDFASVHLGEGVFVKSTNRVYWKVGDNAYQTVFGLNDLGMKHKSDGLLPGTLSVTRQENFANVWEYLAYLPVGVIIGSKGSKYPKYQKVAQNSWKSLHFTTSDRYQDKDFGMNFGVIVTNGAF